MGHSKRRVSAILDAKEVSLATHLIQDVRAAGDIQLEELLDRLRVRADELQEEHTTDPGNQALMAELAWTLCVNNEVRRILVDRWPNLSQKGSALLHRSRSLHMRVASWKNFRVLWTRVDLDHYQGRRASDRNRSW